MNNAARIQYTNTKEVVTIIISLTTQHTTPNKMRKEKQSEEKEKEREKNQHT